MCDRSAGPGADDLHGPWGPTRFSAWFATFHSSDDARRRSRAAAARRGVPDLADDLHHEWYLSVCTTVHRAANDDGGIPDWIISEEAATAYVLRALDNDALDAARRRAREPSVQSPRHGDRDDEIIDVAVNDDGLAAAELNQALAQVVRDLNDHLRDGSGGCPGCPSELTVRICLGVVARLRDPDRLPPVEQLRGGTTEWDRLVYEVMSIVAPERMAVTADGRMAERTRQAKRRCGGCARRLLDELLGRHLDGGTP
ncbi:MAG: hypothetical protein ACOYOQ_14230 [Microthrixaceae bacterium]